MPQERAAGEPDGVPVHHVVELPAGEPPKASA